MLSLANIHSSYRSVANRFKNVANWDEAKVPLNQITGEINALHQELTQHLGDLIQGFSNSRFHHGANNNAERGYRSRTLTIGGYPPMDYISGYHYNPNTPEVITNHDIPELQIMETKTRAGKQAEETEFTVKIRGGKESFGTTPLQYSFKAEEFGAKINESNLERMNVEDGIGNGIQYSAKGATDFNDANSSTQMRDTPVFSFETFDANEIPSHALNAKEQPPALYYGGRGNPIEKYHRYLSEAHGWNKAFATAN